MMAHVGVGGNGRRAIMKSVHHLSLVSSGERLICLFSILHIVLASIQLIPPRRAHREEGNGGNGKKRR